MSENLVDVFRVDADIDQQLNHVVNTYNITVAAAYNKMLHEFMQLFFEMPPVDLTKEELEKIDIKAKGTRIALTGVPVKGDKKEIEQRFQDLQQRVREITGRCGGRCGAAKKKAEGDIIVLRLIDAQRCYALDITPRVAQLTALKILGTRSLAKSKLAVFATTGRTSLQRSALIDDPTPLDRFVDEIKVDIAAFQEHQIKTREINTSQWFKVWREQKEAFHSKSKK